MNDNMSHGLLVKDEKGSYCKQGPAFDDNMLFVF